MGCELMVRHHLLQCKPILKLHQTYSTRIIISITFAIDHLYIMPFLLNKYEYTFLDFFPEKNGININIFWLKHYFHDCF
jgi:hypothetical protein